MPNTSKRRRLLLAGGDLRQIAAAGELAKEHEVTVTGFDRFGKLPETIHAAEHSQALPDETDALILPMPVTQDGVFLHTPFGSRAIQMRSLLPLVRSGGTVYGGMLTEKERIQIENSGLHAVDYVRQETFALRNAIPTAEGAIQIAMQELPVVLNRLPCLILGAGRISSALQQRLRGLGAAVTIAARRCSDLARGQGDGWKPKKAGHSQILRPAKQGCVDTMIMCKSRQKDAFSASYQHAFDST